MSLLFQVAPPSLLKPMKPPDVSAANRFLGSKGLTTIMVSASSPDDFVMLKFGPTVNDGVMRASRFSTFNRTLGRDRVGLVGKVGRLSHERSEFQGMGASPEDCHEANRISR